MNFKITVLPENRIITAEKNSCLSHVLTQNGISISAPCGGNGKCGKCKVKLIKASAGDLKPDSKGMIKSCKTVITEDLIIEIPNTLSNEISLWCSAEKPPENAELGVALDIGTTTIAAGLVDLKRGSIYKKATCLNPQSIFGGDVLSRITACSNGHLLDLQKLILQKISDILNAFGSDNSLMLEEMTVAANTTMLHLLIGADPTPMGTYPFTPAFTDIKYIRGEELGLNVKNVTLLPSISAYIGADISSGILATNLQNAEDTALFVDIGTNGEMALSHKGKIYVSSTAAGPAIEGASMECGLGGVPGAVNRVFLRGGKFGFTTVENLPPKGICGSGYVDLIALLLKENLIDEYGGWNLNSSSVIREKLKNDRFYLTDDVFLSLQDIHEFQLAKAAIAAGVNTLMRHCDVETKDVNRVYLAGGMGYYINTHSAATTGLLPKNLSFKAKAVENTALKGAEICLMEPNKIKDLEKITQNAQVVELSLSEHFQSEYTSNLIFNKNLLGTKKT